MIALQRPDVGRPAGRAQPVTCRPEELAVDGEPRRELRRQPVVGVDGLDRTDRLAQAAVDAFVGLDVERAPALVDAVDRAGLTQALSFTSMQASVMT